MALSIDAKLILASHFAWGDDTVVTLGNEVSRMTDQSRMAMTELMMGGIVAAEKADDNRAESISYRLTEKGKKLDRKQTEKWMNKHGKRPFVVPIHNSNI